MECLYPPAFLALVAPLTLLPMGIALVLWDAIQLAALGFVLAWTLRNRSRPHELALTLVFLTLWFPAFVGLRFGQVAGILAVGWLMFGHELRSGHELRAGLWLSLLTIKPPLLLVPFCLLIYLRRERALIGLLTGGAVWLLVSIAMVGPSGFLGYLRTLLVAAGAQTSDAVYRTSTYSWASITNVLPSQGWLIFLVIDALTIALTLRLARGRSVEDSMATATPAMLLASPHVLVHDLLPLVATLPALPRRGRALIAFSPVAAFAIVPITHMMLAAPQIISLLMFGMTFVFGGFASRRMVV